MIRLLPIVAMVLGIVLGGWTAYLEISDPGDDYRGLMEVAQSPLQSPLQGIQGRGPRARVPEDEYQFGIMDRGEEKSHVFTVYNDGDAPLTLDLVNTTCKCAIGELPDGAVPPGSSGEVTMKWEARTYERQYRQSATIETNDPRKSVFMLSVAGRVAHVVQAYPQALSFSDVTMDDTRTASFSVFGFREGDLRVVNYEWTNPNTQHLFDVEFSDADEETLAETPDAKSAITATVTLKPGLGLGGFQQGLQLTTNHSATTIVDVPIRGRIISDVTVVGRGYGDRTRTMKMGLVDSQEGKRHALMVLVKGPHRDEVTLSKGALDPADTLDVEIGEPTKYATVVKYPIVVVVRPGARTMSRLAPQSPGRVVIETTHPRVTQLELNVSFAVQE